MGNRPIYVFDDLEQLDGLPCGEARHSFNSLPFYIPPKKPKVSIPNGVRKYMRCTFYRSLLRGIDYLIGVRANVINLSLGLISTDFDAKEPIHVATRTAYENGIVVVTAVGNRGPELNTIQSVARAPWVFGVGATDNDRVLLRKSSRGSTQTNINPTVVSSGVSRFNDKAKALGIRTFKPNTSFACAEISAVASFTKMILEIIRTLIRNFEKGMVGDHISPIHLQLIGLCDTGISEGLEEIQIPEIQEIVESGGTSFSIKHSADGLKWVNEFVSYALENPNSQRKYDPDVAMVKEFIGASALPLAKYKEFEVGSGYLDLDVAIEWWAKLPLNAFMRYVFPRERETINRFFNSRNPLFLFDKEKLETIAAASTSIGKMVKVR